MNPASYLENRIYQELMYGQKLRREAWSLSVTQLAKKFDRSKFAIEQIINGTPDEDPETNRLVLECYEEAQRLLEEFEHYKRKAIAERYGRTYNEIRRIVREIDRGKVAAA